MQRAQHLGYRDARDRMERDDHDRREAITLLYDALRAMVDRWEPGPVDRVTGDTEGADRRMWLDAKEALERVRIVR